MTMTIQEAYLRSLQKNEQNLANGGIKLDPGRFVLLFRDSMLYGNYLVVL